MALINEAPILFAKERNFSVFHDNVSINHNIADFLLLIDAGLEEDFSVSHDGVCVGD